MNKRFGYLLCICFVFVIECNGQQNLLIDLYKSYELSKEINTSFKQGKYEKSYKLSSKLLKYNPGQASFYLGLHLYYGLGCKKNIRKAIEQYEYGAYLGDELCQQSLSVFYFEHRESYENKRLAFKWSRIASLNPEGIDEGAEDVTYYLAQCYLNGIGTVVDKKMGELWMAFSAVLSNDKAEEYLAEKYKIIESDDESSYDCKLFNHLDSLLFPFISNKGTLEAKFLYCSHYMRYGNLDDFYRLAKELYYNEKFPKEGKYIIGDLLYAYYKDYKYDLYNAEIIENDLKKYENISEKAVNNWCFKQYVKCFPQ